MRDQAAWLMAVIGGVANPAGARLSGLLPEKLLKKVFCLLMLYLARSMVLQVLLDQKLAASHARPRPPCGVNPATGRLDWNSRCLRILGWLGLAAGACSGLFGVGGGLLIVPGLRRVSDIPIHCAVATSLAVIVLVSIGGVLSGYAQGILVSAQGWSFVLAVVARMLAGRRLSLRLPARSLQLGFAVAQALLAIALFANVIGG